LARSALRPPNSSRVEFGFGRLSGRSELARLRGSRGSAMRRSVQATWKTTYADNKARARAKRKGQPAYANRCIVRAVTHTRLYLDAGINYPIAASRWLRIDEKALTTYIALGISARDLATARK